MSEGEVDPSPSVFERDRLKILKGDFDDLRAGVAASLLLGAGWPLGVGRGLLLRVLLRALFCACRLGEEALGLTVETIRS